MYFSRSPIPFSREKSKATYFKHIGIYAFRKEALLKFTKDLSFGERKLYDTAQLLLVSELSTARNTNEETIISEIESFFIHDNPDN